MAMVEGILDFWKERVPRQLEWRKQKTEGRIVEDPNEGVFY